MECHSDRFGNQFKRRAWVIVPQTPPPYAPRDEEFEGRVFESHLGTIKTDKQSFHLQGTSINSQKCPKISIDLNICSSFRRVTS